MHLSLPWHARDLATPRGRCPLHGSDRHIKLAHRKLIPQHCEIQAGPLEIEEVLGRTQRRLRGAMLIAPSPKHAQNIVRAVAISPAAKSQVPSRKPDLSKTELLNAERAACYRSAVRCGIYLLADRRGITDPVQDLAWHMSAPRECEGECIEIFAQDLQAKPDYVRVTALDADAYEGDINRSPGIKT